MFLARLVRLAHQLLPHSHPQATYFSLSFCSPQYWTGYYPIPLLLTLIPSTFPFLQNYHSRLFSDCSPRCRMDLARETALFIFYLLEQFLENFCLLLRKYRYRHPFRMWYYNRTINRIYSAFTSPKLIDTQHFIPSYGGFPSKYHIKHTSLSTPTASISAPLISIQPILFLLLPPDRSSLYQFFAYLVKHLVNALSALCWHEIGRKTDGLGQDRYVAFFNLGRHVALISHQANHYVAVRVVLGLLNPVVFDLFEGAGVSQVVNDQHHLWA